MFQIIAQEKKEFNYEDFKREFKNVSFTGRQSIPMIKNNNGHRHGSSSLHIDQSCMTSKSKHNFSVLTSKWETDHIDKLKRIIKGTGKSLDQVFN